METLLSPPAATVAHDRERQARVREYHRDSSHRFEAYARGPGTLDWDAQPAPFRSYPGSAACPLPLVEELLAGNSRPRLQAALGKPYRAADAASQAIEPDLASLGALLQLSFGLTAWKRFGPDRWALRANPSSGNLHPVEAWVIGAGIGGLADGVHHYRPEDHALECRASDPAAPGMPSLHIALSSAMWREAWKYGERAFRYCQLDVGHALGALRYAAALLGWRLQPRPEIDHAALAARLGLDRSADYPARRAAFTEREEAELVIGVDWGAPLPLCESAGWRRAAQAADWFGRASELDPRPFFRWPAVDEVARETRSEAAPAPTIDAGQPSDVVRPRAQQTSPPATKLILGRRSAQRFDPEFRMPRSDFIRMLDALCASDATPLDALPAQRDIALLFFVHRVRGVEPGLYVLPRHDQQGLVRALAERFPRVRQPGPIAGSALRCIATMESVPLKRIARSLHCHQDIAANACFALALMADLDGALGRGAGEYRTLHRAAGLLGQLLYLEAEAAGLRGTGIGCFFDEPVREVLGLTDSPYLSLYHFTVGRGLDDPRIETSPPYAADRLKAFAAEPQP